MISARRLILLSLVSVVFSALVRADDDDDDWEEDDSSDDAAGSAYAESASNNDAVTGMSAATHFLQYSDLKVPAGERVELLLAVTNVPSNPSYDVVYVQSFLMNSDKSRFVQNFSSQIYSRPVDGGETGTVKYSFTPDAQLDPLDYHMGIKVFFKNDANKTFVAEAYDGPVTLTDPLGYDFKAVFTFIAIIGGIYGAYKFLQSQKDGASAPARTTKKTTSATRSDAEWGVSAEHVKYAQMMDTRAAASRSNSNRK